MKLIGKTILTIFILSALVIFGYLADEKDFFHVYYIDLSASQKKIFEWQDGDNEEQLIQRYRQYFYDSTYTFPRQKVGKVKRFKSIPMISFLTSKTLKTEHVEGFVNFCNDTTNFDWDETTSEIKDSEYYCKFYNEDGKVAAKIYFCLDDGGMIHSRPFSPTLKFGSLSPKGLNFVRQLFGDNGKWE